MKFLPVLFLCWLNFTGLSAQTDTIPLSYTWSERTPLLCRSGATVHLRADSIYMVNAPRYRFYRELHDVYLRKSETELSEIILRHYQSNLLRRDSLYDLLFLNNWETELRVTELAEQTRDLQQKLSETLQLSENLLHGSRRQLLLTEETLKKSKRRSRLEKIVLATAGMGIGVLTGFLIL